MQTQTTFRRTTAWLAVVLATSGLVAPVAAQSPEDPAKTDVPRFEQVVRINSNETHLELVEKFSKDLELTNRIVRVDGFDESVVKVTPLDRQPNRIRVQAVAQGVTTVVLVDEFNESFMIEIFVKGDARHLQAIINTKFPNSAVEAFKIQDSVVLRGWVTEPSHITQIVEIAEQFYPVVLNQMSLGGVQQVLLKVKVMEVQRAKIRQMGFNFQFLSQDWSVAATPGQIPLVDSTFTFGISGSSGVFDGLIEALKEERLLKILAEPELVTVNGRPANLLSGGEFPFLVPQSLGTVTINWKEFGVRLEAVPIILGEGRLRLELQPEVSERDFANGVVVQGQTVPALTTRRVNTQVEMNFGQSLMIAGLIATRQTAETAKIPLLGDIPWLGAAFRRVKYDNVETELVVIVTPELVAPLNQKDILGGGPGLFTDAPTDRELYRDGMLEVPFGGGAPCHDCPVPTPGMIAPHGAAVGPSPTLPPAALPPAAPPAVLEQSPRALTIPPPPTETSMTKPASPGGRNGATPQTVQWQPQFGQPFDGVKGAGEGAPIRKVDLSDSLIAPTSTSVQSNSTGSTSVRASGTTQWNHGSRPGLIAPGSNVPKELESR